MAFTATQKGENMTAENLQLIIEMINTIGANSKDAFIWWLIAYYAKIYLFGLLWTIIGFLFIKWGFGCIKSVQINQEFMAAADVNEYWLDGQKSRAIQLIHENKDYIRMVKAR
jgi:hypothetical protein